MPADSRENTSASRNHDAFVFVQALAAEASAGRIEIPCFPDVAIRIRRVLADENCDAGQVARVTGAEPALAAKLLHMANSVALNAAGVKVTELKGAIARIGFSNVRTASLAYAMEQLRNAPALATIRQPLNNMWELSVNVASLAFVAARSWSRVSPDRALLAGLMHAMGRIYILSRSVEHPGLFSDMDAYHQIERDWHATISKIVLESWDISPEIVTAVEQFERPDRKGGGEPDLTDVLAVAHMLATLQDAPDTLEAQLSEAPASRRLGITHESVSKVLQETASELASLHAALGA
jgi:HD-like signal output (HDOD) protein